MTLTSSSAAEQFDNDWNILGCTFNKYFIDLLNCVRGANAMHAPVHQLLWGRVTNAERTDFLQLYTADNSVQRAHMMLRIAGILQLSSLQMVILGIFHPCVLDLRVNDSLE